VAEFTAFPLEYFFLAGLFLAFFFGVLFFAGLLVASWTFAVEVVVYEEAPCCDEVPSPNKNTRRL